MSLHEAEPFVMHREDSVKTTPLCTLQPLMGWTLEEKQALHQHILDPLHHPLHPDAESWIDG